MSFILLLNAKTGRLLYSVKKKSYELHLKINVGAGNLKRGLKAQRAIPRRGLQRTRVLDLFLFGSLAAPKSSATYCGQEIRLGSRYARIQQD
jgi:hypothetical protein